MNKPGEMRRRTSWIRFETTTTRREQQQQQQHSEMRTGIGTAGTSLLRFNFIHNEF